MSFIFDRRFWLRNRRRLTDARGVIERRRFKAVRNEFYDKLWREAAAEVGAQAQTRPDGLVQISRGGMATFVHHSDLMLDSAIVSRMVLNKALTYELMAAKGLRIPESCSYDLDSIDQAETFMRARSGPVVVKPADGTGCGHGVTTGIDTEAALHTASRHAAAFHPQLLVEEQLTGASYRLLFLDGEFIDAVRRDSPVVVGDGKSSIGRLAQDENQKRRMHRPISALSPLIIDQESRNTLAGAGKSPSYVPAAGETVRVKLAVNENAAAQNHSVRDSVHEDIIRTGSRIVREFGIGFAGLDVTSHDISAPIEQGETIFNEINAGPGIHHHYLISEPDGGAGVAPLILERMFAKRRGVIEL